ncbi:dihydrodipicolinate synthase family protein [Nonomuraea sp. bgisy101]|uniref:dihydrodipicolinate synthase family protein n=1 Tax=Nonomuraea sp. bgisy101 TaxID=3413784 RepID=UPI003D742DA4
MRGVWPAALTMFAADGSLDERATAEHLDWLVEQGAHGLVVGGTSGEFVAMSGAERRRLLEVALDAVGERVPVLAGTGAYSTAETVELTLHAERARASAALVVLPYYQRPTPREIVGHYRAVAKACRLPVWVYNIPANAAVPPLPVAELARLHEEGVVHGVKSTLPTVHEVHELRAATGDGFSVFYGGFAAPLEAMAGGAHGWISGLLNVTTAAGAGLWEAMRHGDLHGARDRWARLLPLRRLVTDPVVRGASDLAIYRGLLRLWGRPAGYCRAPLRDLDREELARLERAWQSVEEQTAAPLEEESSGPPAGRIGSWAEGGDRRQAGVEGPAASLASEHAN